MNNICTFLLFTRNISNMIFSIKMMIKINTKVFSAIKVLNIGAIYGYLNGTIKSISEKDYIVCLVDVE